ncbi:MULTISPECIES: LCP family protein [Arthrobacter]|uniref:LCP family protein n=2 Tax=Arthrobacter TaxID=1663 RepID=A0ABU9KLD2_9MICC|nr:LCP family protein [Arthrobacter sp. YJM1]MDP5227370.1 LCP family protein [Arthrobacter sp. YJM1]
MSRMRLTDPLHEPQNAVPGDRVRRAWALIVLTLLIPGAAQLVAGNKRFGRLALRVTLTVWALLLLTVIIALVNRGFLVSLLAHPVVLAILPFLLLALMAGWVVVWVNTFRLCRLAILPPRWRGPVAGVLVVLMVLSGGALGYGAYLLNVARGTLNDVFDAGRPPFDPVDGRYNIALLGGDAGAGRTGLRPDSMSVISIDATTGASAIISVPRSLQYARFPADSPMHKFYPDGFNNCDPDPLNCLLNAVYTDATDNHKDLYGAGKNAGAEATKDAISGTLGITIQAYALIDMDGFAQLIDAMGGVKMRVGAWVPISGGMLPGSDTRHVKPDGWIKPGNQTLNGFQAQWFARSRENVDDFARVQRQQCVQQAMLKQLDPTTVITKFEAIAKAGAHVVDTDIPQGQLGGFVDLTGKAKGQASVRMTVGPPDFPAGFSLADPDFDLIHQRVKALLAKATGDTKASAATAPSGTVSEDGTPLSAVAVSGGAQASGPLATAVQPKAADQLPPDFPLSTTRPDGDTITEAYLNSLYDAQDYEMLDILLAKNGNCAAL